MHVGGIANLCSHCGKQYGDFSKTQITATLDPAIPFLGIYVNKIKTIQKRMCPYIHCRIIYNSKNMKVT